MKKESRTYLIETLRTMGVAMLTGGFLGYLLNPGVHTGIIAMVIGLYLIILGLVIVELTD